MYGPDGVDLGPSPSTPQFLMALRNYAWENVPPELLDGRRDVWQFLGDYGPKHNAPIPEDWWVLYPSEELKEHKGLLMNDLQCDW